MLTFRTSRRVADTPGLVGIMSFVPRTVDKLGVLDNLSSFRVFSNGGLDVMLCDVGIPEFDCSEVDKVGVKCILAFDAFFANDLNAAAKDEAWGV